MNPFALPPPVSVTRRARRKQLGDELNQGVTQGLGGIDMLLQAQEKAKLDTIKAEDRATAQRRGALEESDLLAKAKRRSVVEGQQDEDRLLKKTLDEQARLKAARLEREAAEVATKEAGRLDEGDALARAAATARTDAAAQVSEPTGAAPQEWDADEVRWRRDQALKNPHQITDAEWQKLGLGQKPKPGGAIRKVPKPGGAAPGGGGVESLPVGIQTKVKMRDASLGQIDHLFKLMETTPTGFESWARSKVAGVPVVGEVVGEAVDPGGKATQLDGAIQKFIAEERNRLFGSAMTPNEERAFNQFSVNILQAPQRAQTLLREYQQTIAAERASLAGGAASPVAGAAQPPAPSGNWRDEQAAAPQASAQDMATEILDWAEANGEDLSDEEVARLVAERMARGGR